MPTEMLRVKGFECFRRIRVYGKHFGIRVQGPRRSTMQELPLTVSGICTEVWSLQELVRVGAFRKNMHQSKTR